MIPYAPAVVAALHDATGVWFDAFPLTPDRVVAGLRAHGVGAAPEPGVSRDGPVPTSEVGRPDRGQRDLARLLPRWAAGETG